MTANVQRENVKISAGSKGPKVSAACVFIQETGKQAATGALADIEAIVSGRAGTIIEKEN